MRTEIIKQILHEGLNLQKKIMKDQKFHNWVSKLFTLKRTVSPYDNKHIYFHYNGDIYFMYDPDENTFFVDYDKVWMTMKRILKLSDDKIQKLISDEVEEHTNYRDVQVYGIKLHSMPELNNIHEGLNLPRKNDMETKLRSSFTEAGYEVLNVAVTYFRHGDDISSQIELMSEQMGATDIDAVVQLRTQVGRITIGFHYDLEKTIVDPIRFNNEFTFRVQGRNEEEILRSAHDIETKSRLLKATVSHIIKIIKRVALSI